MLLATTGGVYDPDVDAVVQDELATEAKAAAAEAGDRDLQTEMERQEQLRTQAGCPSAPTWAARRAPARPASVSPMRSRMWLSRVVKRGYGAVN
jgi:hypothetical protein